jgi:hypothetical protein
MKVAHVNLTELCLRYLSLPAFSYTLPDAQLREHTISGTYAFLEYALSSWTVHVEHTLETCDLSVSVPVSLTQLFHTFFEMHWKPARRQTRPTKRIQDLTSRIAQLEISSKIEDSLSSMHCLMTTNLSNLEAVQTLDLFLFLARVRVMIEDLATQADAAIAIQQFYGQQLYKCPRIYCRSFHEGFVTAAQRDIHVERHDRSHLCSTAGCLYATLGFPKAGELAKHIKIAHPQAPSEEDFSVLIDNTTQLNGNTLDNLSTGAEEVQGTQHEPSAMLGPSNASDQREYILEPSNPESAPSNGAESRRPQKHVAPFQCNLCPKRFTRAHNLRSHLRVHTDDRPFVCTVCGKAYARRHDRKRHEELHSGEKKFVCRGSLMSGAKWGCGRRFARADALGRHFRTEAGRACIMPLLKDEAAARRKAWLEEHQQSQIAAGLLVPQKMTEPQGYMTDDFRVPAALLQQYPALAGLDWSALHAKDCPPNEDA